MASLEDNNAPETDITEDFKGYEQKTKFLKGEKIEVRNCCGCDWKRLWRAATVRSCIGKSRRAIVYNFDKKEDSISIASIVESKIAPPSQRCFVRPPPPKSELRQPNIRFGDCVDVSIDGFWMEAVVIDHEDGEKKLGVFSPDEKVYRKVDVDELRTTWDWNQSTGCWTRRGNWLFLKALQDVSYKVLSLFDINLAWSQVKTYSHYRDDTEEWMCGSPSLWEKLVLKYDQDKLLHRVPYHPYPTVSFDLTGVCFKPNASGEHASEQQHEISSRNTESSSRNTESSSRKKHARGKFTPRSKILRSWTPLEIEGEPHLREVELCAYQIHKQEDMHKARLHLADFDWKIFFRHSKRPGRPGQLQHQPNFRYTSPNEEPTTYDALYKACMEHVVKRRNDFQTSSPGWEIKVVQDREYERFQYISPNGITFNSLHEAISEGERLREECS